MVSQANERSSVSPGLGPTGRKGTETEKLAYEQWHSLYMTLREHTGWSSTLLRTSDVLLRSGDGHGTQAKGERERQTAKGGQSSGGRGKRGRWSFGVSQIGWRIFVSVLPTDQQGTNWGFSLKNIMKPLSSGTPLWLHGGEWFGQHKGVDQSELSRLKLRDNGLSQGRGLKRNRLLF